MAGTCPELPYYAPAETLPAPLPRVAGILASKKVLSKYGRGVILYNQHYAVKFGKGVSLQEGLNMLFVQRTTDIPVPKVYALFHDKATNNNFIVQEYIPGKNLGDIWDDLDDDEKTDITSQLRRHLDQLRSLRQTGPPYFGGVWRRPSLDWYLNGGAERGGEATRPGPFENEEDWVEAMVNVGIGANRSLPNRSDDDDKWMKYVFHAFFQGHKPIFTHGDLTGGNIRLREDGTVALLDWQYSGWHPDFWEYCTLVSISFREGDRVLRISEYLDEYLAELGWMMHFRAWVMYNGVG
jgi:aminoglycoside phosphotransferase (APT) family kinase protein